MDFDPYLFKSTDHALLICMAAKFALLGSCITIYMGNDPKQVFVINNCYESFPYVCV